MIDIHTHLLPQVDDGAQTMDMALQMARIAAEDGIKKIYCTSHLTADENPLDELQHRQEVLENLHAELKKENNPLELELGAEWLLSYELLDVLPKAGRLGNSKAFLFELSGFMSVEYVPPFLLEAKPLGYKPVMAHPERHRMVTVETYETLLAPIVQEGACLQLTAGSILGLFGEPVRATALAIAERFSSSIVVASDAHNISLRAPRVKEAYTALDRLQSGLAQRVTDTLKALLS